MLIKTNINDRYKETELHVCKDTMDEEVKQILGELHAMYDPSVAGTDERGNRCMIQPADIVTFYAEKQKVFAKDNEKTYTIPRTLSDLEKELESYGFVRISKSEIVNFRKIKSLDMSFTGTIRVIMKNGYETYTSRRNVAKLKELLQKGGEKR
jgi:DNA-binding LytR/AlgR family response regulator